MMKPNILIVDDEKNLVEFMADTLDAKGYTVAKAYNGKTAKDMIDKGRFDIVITDIKMPEMDGHQLLKEIKTAYPDIIVIMMTSYPEIESVITALRNGAYDYIEKPVKTDVILHTVEQSWNKKLLEIENKQLSEQLVLSAQSISVSQLAAGVAHQLRNPLYTILSTVQLLISKDDFPKSFKTDLEVIQRNIRLSNDIITNFLQFSKPIPSDFSYHAINEIIDMTISLLEFKMVQHKIQLIKKFSTNLPEIKCVSHLLIQAFLNIITNSVESMLDGGNLTISTRLEEKKDFVEISFKDTGAGIPADSMDKIFDSFFTTKKEGIGLGLFIVKYIITEQHKGKIFVESEISTGTKITVLLPVSECQS